MRDAFAARMHELQRVVVSPVPLPTEEIWWCAWYEKLVALLRLEVDDPLFIPLVVAVVRWGLASGVDDRTQRLALEALAWACRDVVPDRTPASVLAAIDSRATLVTRVWRRLAAPVPESPAADVV